MDPTIVAAVAVPAALGFTLGRAWAVAVPVAITVLALVWAVWVSGDVVTREGVRAVDFVLVLVLIYGALASVGVVLGLVVRWSLTGRRRRDVSDG